MNNLKKNDKRTPVVHDITIFSKTYPVIKEKIIIIR